MARPFFCLVARVCLQAKITGVGRLFVIAGDVTKNAEADLYISQNHL